MNALLRSVIAVTILVSGCNSAEKIHAETEATRGSNKAALRAGQADQGQIDQAALEALEAYVRHLVPVMWGRHAHSLAEIEVLVQLAQQDGRDGLVRAMARSPEFEQHWTPLLLDWLETPRMHSQQNASCYGRRLLPEVDASLAKFVRDNRPTDSEFGQRFTVRDVVASSLALGDLSAVFLANLPSHFLHEAPVEKLDTARSLREGRVSLFARVYLHRQMACLGCHNSEYSTSDDPDPKLDRTWRMPGISELPLLGQSGGQGYPGLRSFFRRKGVVGGFWFPEYDKTEEEKQASIAASYHPWGMDSACGVFLPTNQRLPDELDTDAFFAESKGADGTIWDIEAVLRSGLDSARNGNVATRMDRPSDHADAGLMFSWLVSESLTDRVFELVYGKSLVLAHNFARNEVQRDMLQELTEHFITSGFNLTELLVATVSQDFFATPVDQEPTWDALFDPWGQDDLDPSERINDVADIVHRLPARTLMRGLYTALEWVEPAEFSIYHLTEDAILQREIGVYLKPNSRGFRGTSFQSALAWDAAFGTCSPRLGKSNCPLIEIMQSPQGRLSQCEICGNMDAVCGWDERCCDVDWDTLCAPHQDFCLSFPPSISLATYPPEAASKETPDFIERVVSEIAQSAVPVSMEDAVIAIKDRLLAHPGISDDEERALLAAVVGTPMDTDIRKDDALEARLRRACAVFAATPDFKLAGLTAPAQLTADYDRAPDTYVPSGQTFQAHCEKLAETMFAPGEVICSAEQATIVR